MRKVFRDKSAVEIMDVRENRWALCKNDRIRMKDRKEGKKMSEKQKRLTQMTASSG